MLRRGFCTVMMTLAVAVAGYAHLMSRNRNWSKKIAAPRAQTDPLMALEGSGRKLWAEERPDEYVLRLRQGWG